MEFIKVFSTWKKSLEFFAIDNLKLFFLVSLNNTKRSIEIFFRKFWYLLVSILITISILFILYPKNIASDGLNSGIVPISPVLGFIFLLLGLILFVYLILLMFIPYLVVRPSVEAKNVFYFKKHLSRIWGFLFIFFMVFIVPMSIGFLRVDMLNYVQASFLFKIFNAFFGLIFSLSVFFFLDIKKKVSSVFVAVFRALKSIVYFLPVFLFFALISLLISQVSFFMYNQGVIFKILYGIFSFVFLFLNLSFIVNYYTMIRHKYYDLLYK
ncbi:MAG: hypothetical protein ABIF12_01195 [bacterium]